MALIIYKNYIQDNSESDAISNEISIVSPSEVKEELPPVTTEEYLNVDLKGAITNPGVYKLKKDSIINDAINTAGGFTKNAYTASINLSKKVSDEMVIFIYTKDEIKKFTNNNSNIYNQDEITNTCPTTSYDITECITKKSSIIEKVEISTNDKFSNSNTTTDKTDTNPTPDKSEDSKKIVNINTATETELTSLSGIGASKAKVIIEYRTTNGPFKTINDILNVKGIGESIFAKIKDYITV